MLQQNKNELESKQRGNGHERNDIKSGSQSSQNFVGAVFADPVKPWCTIPVNVYVHGSIQVQSVDFYGNYCLGPYIYDFFRQ